MNTHNDAPEVSYDDPGRHAMTQRVTWVSVVVNIFLTAAQVVAGIISHQSAMKDGETMKIPQFA